MKFASALISLLSVGLVPAAAIGIEINDIKKRDQSVIQGDDKLKVPGDNPLTFCDKDHSADLVEIKNVDLSPNPPVPGQDLVIKASGIVKKDIEKGAYVQLQVKYGVIRLISTKADLCEQIENVDLECPIKEGDLVVTKTVQLPKEIPPGKYTVFADVYTVDDEPMTCLEASVSFARGKGGFLDFDL